ncbi:MAG: protein phosphatase 2C domain-containing protein [Actinomycetota bacterium]|nr:protein phosphatase 2C domain-containing protein [Actinomycetota bacterium]
MTAVDSVPIVARCPGCAGSTQPDWRYCEECGRHLSVEREVPRTLVSGLRDPRRELDLGVVAGGTDVGRLRSHNEDAVGVGVFADHAVAVVCDGVSSVLGADEAAVRAASVGLRTLLDGVAKARPTTAASTLATLAAADVVAGLGDPDDADSPCCTYVSATVGPTKVVISWVGDSRAYWVDADGVRPLTVDDSRAGRLLAAGIDPSDPLFTDPSAHALERWLGADVGVVEPKTHVFVPDKDGLVLVCSDGLSHYFDSGAITAPDSDAHPVDAVRVLLADTLAAGAHDNVSVAALSFTVPDSLRSHR